MARDVISGDRLMRVSRLYVSAPLNVGQQLELDTDSAHYFRTVLRLKADAEVVLFNGSGGEYVGRLLEVSRKHVRVSIEKWSDRSVESPLEIHLGMGISRGDRMDMAVQKAVELGVTSITPLLTKRCNVQFKGDKKQQKLNHWQKIAQHASEQSGRTIVPLIHPVEVLDSWVDNQHGLKIFLDPYAEKNLNALKPETQQVTLLTGAEGGFADIEREIAQQADFIPIQLGQRILRTETASLAALSAIQMLWGDFQS